MNEDIFNGSIRKFLKALGVSAQRLPSIRPVSGSNYSASTLRETRESKRVSFSLSRPRVARLQQQTESLFTTPY